MIYITFDRQIGILVKWITTKINSCLVIMTVRRGSTADSNECWSQKKPYQPSI